MRIRTAGLALVAMAATFGCASSGDAETEVANMAAEAETVQDVKDQQAVARDLSAPDEVVCRRIIQTGTRLGTKVCATNRQWAASEKHAQDTTEDMQRQPIGGPVRQ